MKKLLSLLGLLIFGYIFPKTVQADVCSPGVCADTTTSWYLSYCQPRTASDGSIYCNPVYDGNIVIPCDKSDCSGSYTDYGCGAPPACNISTIGFSVKVGCCITPSGPYCGDGSCDSDEGCDCEDCEDEPECNCSPSCPTSCGQADGCGGTCPNTDAGIPTAPTLNPANNAIVTVTQASPNVRVSWSAPNLADLYDLEIYPAGTSCAAAGAYCNYSRTTRSYSFLPQYPSYYYRVRALNNTCSQQYSAWAGATHNIRGTIADQV